MVLICNIRDPVTGQNYSRDVRYVAQKAENYLVRTGTGDTALFGPELEHFTIFPSKQTFVSALSMSALCHKRTFACAAHVGPFLARPPDWVVVPSALLVGLLLPRLQVRYRLPSTAMPSAFWSFLMFSLASVGRSTGGWWSPRSLGPRTAWCRRCPMQPVEILRAGRGVE